MTSLPRLDSFCLLPSFAIKTCSQTNLGKATTSHSSTSLHLPTHQCATSPSYTRHNRQHIFVHEQGEDPTLWPFSTTYQPQSILAAENPFDNAFAAAPFPQTNQASPYIGTVDGSYELNSGPLNDLFDFGPTAKQGGMDG